MSVLNKILRSKGIKKLFRALYYPVLRKKVLKDFSAMTKHESCPKQMIDSTNVCYLRTDMWAKNNTASGAVAYQKIVGVEIFCHIVASDALARYVEFFIIIT